jgi:hypothetical protein
MISTRTPSITTLDGIMEMLPKEIQTLIIFYAHPTISSSLKNDIQVTATHWRIGRIQKEWSTPSEKYKSYKCSLPPFSWSGMLEHTLVSEERKEVFIALSKCGCCHRHSTNVFDVKHCTTIVGSRTNKKYHHQKTWGGKQCSCWCRSHMRYLLGFDYSLHICS